ncbi:UbiH/UbiF family hydroxylase [Pseudorhodoplanes sinuspersici]|uniref:2-octaprenyl-6-methoxyphenyl hydroxylase n=1 Tax=Pseudorhodoplanes sinuspersici TaxID=1235591 RepID=A0A1W6ZWH8_9HYPH|nr:UbiH/UbiF family hydroxylase [Pseudorhodoplanes sinuspersici]ARQ01737.1 2-octaprenyl-6-methoxyphenyl hydroxylase [Pseudorhodoplanes sinuspersici]RKE73478.1 2-octaprenyl-3-methyl-6-methoxy-1,4-benzoquinol hydroxylase [Pseudorhodoplanes sinuspersici]
MNAGSLTADVAVVGGGPSGLTAALALASAGLDTVLVAPPAPSDNRTTALLASSIAALETLVVWEACRDKAAPLRTLRIVDDTGRLWRAPEARFEADEIGLEAFAYNIENRHLIAALETAAAHRLNLRVIEDEAAMVSASDDLAHIRTARGTEIDARLVVGADGRHSICRATAGIEMHAQRYPQIALTFNIAHSRPHHDISTEFHTEAGPFTTVPLPGNRSSIVCVVTEKDAHHLQTLSGETLDCELERRSHSILGKVKTEPGYGIFPLAIESASLAAAHRIALIGEAAHRIPPIGAQGLNLGLRDAAAIAEVAADHRDDPGAPDALSRYENMRRADVMSRTLAVDLLNRSLLSGFLPIQGLRGLGMHVLNTVGPLRRAVMREGVMPRGSQPRLMRGEALR